MKTYEKELQVIRELTDKIEDSWELTDLLKLIEFKNSIPFLKNEKINFRLSNYENLPFELIEGILNNKIEIKYIENIFFETETFLRENDNINKSFSKDKKELLERLKFRMIGYYGEEKAILLLANMFDDYYLLECIDMFSCEETYILYNLYEMRYNLKNI